MEGQGEKGRWRKTRSENFDVLVHCEVVDEREEVGGGMLNVLLCQATLEILRGETGGECLVTLSCVCVLDICVCSLLSCLERPKGWVDVLQGPCVL